MTGAIGLPDYMAEVKITELRLAPIPVSGESQESELDEPLRCGRSRQFLRRAYVADRPETIRSTWLAWVREAEALTEPPAVLSVSVYSHCVDSHTDPPLMLIFDHRQRCYRLAT